MASRAKGTSKTSSTKSASKKTTTKSTPAKKSPAKKATAKKTPAKKATASKTIAKKTTAKSTTRKTADSKTAAKKTSTVKKSATTTTKKTAAKKAPAKKVAAKKVVAKKTAVKKTTSKTTAKKAVPKTTKKVAVTKTSAKKTPAKKAVKSKSIVDSNVAIEPRGFMGIEPYQEQAGEEYMNERQVAHFIHILNTWKQSLMQEVDRTLGHMQDEAANFPDPNDRASQEEEFSLELRTRDRERKLIKKIDKTLLNISNDEYGYCDACGIEIGIRRLEARPTATLCIDCKTLAEIKERQTTA